MKCLGVSKCAASKSRKLLSALSLPFLFLIGWAATAQISVVTQHYDTGRTGANTSETILTPTNVNSQQFGKLFSQSVDGYVYAQPLYLPAVVMGSGTPQAGTKHNVVFVATENDSVYAFDADSNAPAANASPLWHITLLDAAHGAAAGARAMLSTDIHTTDIVPQIGITGTPVIDPTTGTLYVVGKTKENNTYVQRLHALDIATGAEKFGGPTVLAASVPGNGTGSVSGTLKFDPFWQNQRSALLLQHGIVYIGFGAHEDMGPWHGWILAYNASTMKQTGAWCTTPNQLRGGVWGAGSGLAADVPDPTGHPFGRLFTASGNGTFDAVAPNYTNAMDYGDSVIKLDLANGVPTIASAGKVVGDAFTPLNQSALDTSDLDQGSGGVLLLPNAASGTQHLLVQAGKTGKVYVLNQENLGGYHPTNTTDPEQKAAVKEVFGMPAYWNGHVYFWASADTLRSFSFVNGVISSTSVSNSAETSNFPGSTPVVSANGTTNGIVWDVLTSGFASQGNEILVAHDATNVSKLLYSSDQITSRDNPGPAVKFSVPVVANGKVYVGAEYQVSVFGLLNGTTQANAPVINPAGQSFASSVTVSMTDSTAGAVIHYTTDGSTPAATSPTYSAPLTVTSTETIKAIAIASGHLDSPISTATYTKVTQTAMPVFSPAPGSYSTAQQVALSDSTSGATIYYTTDGTTPTTSSAKYSGAITISATTTLKAIATAPNLSNSAVASGLYTIGSTGTQAAAPTFTPIPGTYSTGQSVTLASATSGATIYYTTNGVTPTTSSPKYSGPILVHLTTTIKAFAAAANLASSAVSTGVYTIGGTPTAATPTFTPAPGSYSTAQQVTLASTTSGASIYFTTDGSTPTTASAKYAGPISVTSTETIKAMATAPNFANSAVATGTYTIGSTGTQAAAPTFTPTPGTYSTGQSVTLASATSGATIYYTTNGVTPTTSSPKYSGPILVHLTTTIKAFAAAANLANSAVSTGVYTIGGTPTAATPTFTPAPGSYSTAQQVTLASTTSGASIYFTTDGSTPTTASAKYSAPITVSATETIKAMATAPNFANSAVATGTYTIGSTGTQAAAPTFTPAPGTYSTGQAVTLASATSGATIYYTTNGVTPTTSSPKYSGPILVHVTTTIKAFAAAAGLGNSAVSTGVYTIGGTPAATPTFSPNPGSFTTAQQVTLSSATSGASIYFTTDGSTPTTASAKYSAPISVTSTETIKAIATATNFTNSAVASGTFTIQAQQQAATPTFSPAPGTYTSAQQVTLASTTAGATIYYTTDGSTPTTASAKYSAPISVSSTETISAMAAATNFTNSAVASGTFTIQAQQQAATPTFSPAPGTYTGAQQIALSTTTAGATIYYTTDGTMPTTASAQYAGPITLGVSATINAMAAAPNFTNSAVASGSYTIQ